MLKNSEKDIPILFGNLNVVIISRLIVGFLLSKMDEINEKERSRPIKK